MTVNELIKTLTELKNDKNTIITGNSKVTVYIDILDKEFKFDVYDTDGLITGYNSELILLLKHR